MIFLPGSGFDRGAGSTDVGPSRSTASRGSAPLRRRGNRVGSEVAGRGTPPAGWAGGAGRFACYALEGQPLETNLRAQFFSYLMPQPMARVSVTSTVSPLSTALTASLT